jgi:uridine kinase
MPNYDLTEVNRAIKDDPEEYLRDCDALLHKSIDIAAESIKNHMRISPVVLLSGPSGSGKTTMSKMLEKELESQGISTVAVSMDNYFLSIDPETTPRTPGGEFDFESPKCLDMELINEHFSAIMRGEIIRIPHFTFATQKRSSSRFTPLRLKDNEIIIYEGIHALNDAITKVHPEAFKLYISASSGFEKDGKPFFESTWLRLIRRIVRDDNFRGSSAEYTLKMWANVLRGERLYIDPNIYKANIALDTTLPYEVSLMKRYADPLIRKLPCNYPNQAELEKIHAAFQFFEGVSTSLVGPDSLLREFIGGGEYYSEGRE